MATATLRPNGAGAETNLTPTGAASNWDCVNEVSPDDATTRVSTSSSSDVRDLYAIEANSIPSGATINSVTVYVRAIFSSSK